MGTYDIRRNRGSFLDLDLAHREYDVVMWWQYAPGPRPRPQQPHQPTTRYTERNQRPQLAGTTPTALNANLCHRCAIMPPQLKETNEWQ